MEKCCSFDLNNFTFCAVKKNYKTLIAFDFDEILTQNVAQLTVISRVKILSSLALWHTISSFLRSIEAAIQ